MVSVDAQTLRNYEKQDRWPDPEMIEDLAKALNCTVSEFFLDPKGQPVSTMTAAKIVIGALAGKDSVSVNELMGPSGDDGDGINETLGGNVKRLRKAAEITQEELAHKANLSRTYIADLERAKVWVGPETISKIAAALNCDEAELFLDPNLNRKPSVREALNVLGGALGATVTYKKQKSLSSKQNELAGIIPTLNDREVTDLLRYLAIDKEVNLEVESEGLESENQKRKKR